MVVKKPVNNDNVVVPSSHKNVALSNFMLEFNGFKIRQRPEDGYIHASDMCKVGKKRWFNYYKNENTKAFIDQLSTETLIRASALITSIKGGNKYNQGTWIHPRIAINLAQWISPQFAVKVTDWVQGFIEGDTKLIADIVKQREKVHNTTASLSLVEISNDIELSDFDKQEQLIRMHEKNVNVLKTQLLEKEGLLIQKDDKISQQGDKIDYLTNLLKDNNIKIDKLLNFASEQKEIASTQTEIAVETRNMLKTAVGNVAEKSENESILRICKLFEPFVKDGISYDYYTIRTSNRSKIDKLQDEKESSLGKMIKICDLYVNSAFDAWNVIKNQLKKDNIIVPKGSSNFYIKNNQGVPLLSDKDFEKTFMKILSENKDDVSKKTSVSTKRNIKKIIFR